MSDYNGMQDISSMQFGVLSQSNQQKPQKNKTQGSLQLPLKILIPAAVIVIVAVLASFFLPEAIAKNRAEKACVVFCSAYVGKEIRWDKYYPKELAEIFEEEFENAGEIENDFDVTVDDIEIKTIKKVDVKENKAFLNKLVKEFYEEMGADAPKRNKIKRGYMVGVKVEGETGYILVLNIDGKYGVYGVTDDEDFEGKLEF